MRHKAPYLDRKSSPCGSDAVNNDDKQIDDPLKDADPGKSEYRNPLDRTYPFEVNGEKLQSVHERLVAEDILIHAKKKGAIPRDPKDYILVSQNESANEYKLNEWVYLDRDNIFVTVSNTPTPVA